MTDISDFQMGEFDCRRRDFSEFEDEITVNPTHSCFDDVTKYVISELCNKRINYLSVCHGICTMESGKQYSHAWVMNQEIIYDFGIINDEKVMLKFKRSEYLSKYKVRWFRQYSVAEAIAAEAIAKRPGPWCNQLTKLCRDSCEPYEEKVQSVLDLFGKVWDLRK